MFFELAKREFTTNYRGSVGGLVWPVLQPVLMLLLYSFTFGYVLNARGGLGDTQTSYVQLLFCGLIIHFAFAEALSKSVRLIVGNKNYVKKVVFPLELLSVTLCTSVLVNLLISIVILIIAIIFISGLPSIQALWTIPILMAFIPALLAVSWFFATVGVFFRDVTQITGLMTHALLFLSPVLYRLENAPDLMQTLLKYNPITVIIEQLRGVLIFSRQPDLSALLAYFCVASVAALAAYFLFMKSKSIYADLL